MGTPNETVLVTGGAGYVGSHTCRRLSGQGYRVVVFDNLENGHEQFAKWGEFVRGDIRDADALDAAFREHQPSAVMHFAALIEVGESTREPGRFYETNVAGSINLLNAMKRNGVDAIVFSSTCATYGDPLRLPLDESHPQTPLNPYGWTKLCVERALLDFDRHAGVRSAILRYFNAAGAAPEDGIGEKHDPETHAIPLLLFTALGLRESFSIFGGDYDTRDGTAVRDYVHVNDLADAHASALRRLLDGAPTDAFNLGTGTGTTVRELIDAVQRITGKAMNIQDAPRREGDSPTLVANAEKAQQILDWRPKHTLDDIISSAWAWHQADARSD